MWDRHGPVRACGEFGLTSSMDDDGRRVERAVDQLRRMLHDDGGVTTADVVGNQGVGVTGRPVVGLLFWVDADDIGEAAATAVRAARRAGAATASGLISLTSR